MKTLKRPAVLAALIAGTLTLSACTPVAGGRCTTPGETVTTDKGATLRCQTNEGQRTPRWTQV